MERNEMAKQINILTFVLLLAICPLFSKEEFKGLKEEAPPPQLQHEITVTATRIETPTREVASSVTVITRQDIDQSTKTTVLDILQEALGVTLIQNGPMGAAASVHIRGGNAEHTLVRELGRHRWYSHYELRVARVERAHGWHQPASPRPASGQISGDTPACHPEI